MTQDITRTTLIKLNLLARWDEAKLYISIKHQAEVVSLNEVVLDNQVFHQFDSGALCSCASPSEFHGVSCAQSINMKDR